MPTEQNDTSNSQTIAAILGAYVGAAERGEDLLSDQGGIRLEPGDVELVTDIVVKMELVCKHCFKNNWTTFNVAFISVVTTAITDEDDVLAAIMYWLYAEARDKQLLLD